MRYDKAFFEGEEAVAKKEGEFYVDPSLGNWWDLEKTVYIDTETINGEGKGSLDALDPKSDIGIVQTNINGKIEVRYWEDPETKEFIRKLNDDGWTFVFHNAPFDVFFLMQKGGIFLNKIFDTMIASQVINAGKTTVDEATRTSRRTEAEAKEILDVMDSMWENDDSSDEEIIKKAANFYSHSLAAVTQRYAKVKIQKDLGNSDWSRRPLTAEQLRYAEEDVKYLPRIVKNMLFVANKLKLNKVLELEMSIIPYVVGMRHRGILINREEWEKQIEEYGIEAADLETRLNLELGLELAEREDLGNSIFGIMPQEFKVSSPTQLKNFFKDELVEGKPIENADETTLKQINHPKVKEILRYKEVNKLATTYGTGYMKFIYPDGRIHSQLNQTSSATGAAIATGRFASSSPNLQNIPAKMIKSLLRAEEGYTLLTCDYSSVEARILAYAADDPNYINSVNSKDIHKENASKMFKKPVDQVTKDERGKAKVLSFAVPLI